MIFKIREFNPVDEEYLDCIAVWHAYFPDQPPLTLEEAIFSDKEPFKGKFRAKFVMLLDQYIIGSGNVTDPYWISADDKISFDYVIHPDHEELVSDGLPIHSLIEQYVLELVANREVNGLMTRAREDKEVMINWLETNGYECRMRMPSSTLDVPSFEFGLWKGHVEKAEGNGIAFHTLEYLKNTTLTGTRSFLQPGLKSI